MNYQFGKDIIPSIFDGKQRTDFREWAENSALYLSTQCVDACEILLEWLVMEKEHVVETAIRAKCEEEELGIRHHQHIQQSHLCLSINEDHRNSEKDCNKR